jgi:hypothetical protein
MIVRNQMKEIREELRRICDDSVVLRNVIMYRRVVLRNAIDKICKYSTLLEVDHRQGVVEMAT